MNYVGSVSMMVCGKVFSVPVAKVAYHASDETRPAGGVVERDDGSLEIFLDARLADEQSQQALERAMIEISRRVAAKEMN
jgi:hypothetical protein